MKRTIILFFLFLMIAGAALAEEWICPSCGEANTSKFCGECGTKKPDGKWTCPTCGNVNEKKFCPECGTKKPEEGTSESDPEPDSEMINVGDYIYFGSYEQDNDSSNGKEDIEWLVLDKTGDSIFVISKYALDCQTYDSTYDRNNTSKSNLNFYVDWGDCTLRDWLNSTFLNDAFNQDELSMIQGVINTSYVVEEYNLIDKVFLLSTEESEKYFSSSDTRICQGTEYCFEQGALMCENDTCWWWLRSQGINGKNAVIVYKDGSVDQTGKLVDSDLVAVRPAMWINL